MHTIDLTLGFTVITLYGAATGRRGGFFTGGYTLGLEKKLIENWILDAGGYVGAGGGGSAAQGGGLMIRPHIGLKYNLNWSLLGLNYTYVDFPNGDISSDAMRCHWISPSVHRYSVGKMMV